MDLASTSGRATCAKPALYGAPAALLTLLVLLTGLVITAFAWRATKAVEEKNARAALAVYATDIQTTIEARLLAYEGLLNAGVGLVEAIWPLSPDQWGKFADQLRVSAAYPGIHGVGFSAAIHDAQDAQRWQAYLDGPAIFDHPQAEWRSPFPESAIVLLEPRDARNREAMGFNMMSEATRRDAMERARDTGRPALSRQMTLLQDMDEVNPHSGFVLYVPAYAADDEPQHLEARRRSLRGFVYSAFRVVEFFSYALPVKPTAAVFEIFDGPSPDAALMYRNGAPPESALHDVRTLHIGGHTWTLRVWQGAASVRSSPPASALVALASAALTLLVASIIGVLMLSRQHLHDRMEASRAFARRERAMNEQLEQRVAERTSELEKANRELSVANRDLETFSYTVSHDLRAPLRAVSGYIELFMAAGGEVNDVQKQHANSIRRNVSRMAQMIEELLKLAFVSRRPLERKHVHLIELIAPILDDIRRTHPQPIEVEVMSERLGEAYVDSALMSQVLTNLLLNAAKFSRGAKPPRIWIGVEDRGSERVYYVRDNGVGFEMKHASKLFGVFERLHREREFEGSGVGLAIVKQIIERHDGRVWAHAEVGAGATFYFTLGEDSARPSVPMQAAA